MPEASPLMLDCFRQQERHALALRSSSAQERIAYLDKLEQWILANQQSIEEAVYQDFRKPKPEVALTDIYPVLSELRYVRRHLKKWMKASPVSTPLLFTGTKLEVRYEPKGICLIIAPWNYPFNLMLLPLVSCLAAGNTAMLKPSELSPATALLLQRLVQEVFPPELVSIFLGEKEVAQQLLSLPFNHIFFTGSPAVGKLVMEAAAKHLSGITLELGGKSPAIIQARTKLRDAAEKIAWGKWTNTGQTCVAPDYVMVPEAEKEAFIAELEAACRRLFTPDDADVRQSSHYARIIGDRHWQRFHEMQIDAQEKGAKLRFGGDSDAAERYFAPTLLEGGDNSATIWQEEIFGPILPLRTYREVDEVIAYVNSHPKPLALYIFGENKAEQELILTQTSAGGVSINDCVLHYLHPGMPFGGINNSGLGKSHGYEGFMDFSNAKGVLRQRSGFTGLKLLYPPYHERARKLINLLVRNF